MTYVPGMGHVPEPPVDPPEAEYRHCPSCGDEMPVVEDERERTVECAECGETLYAFDWDGEAERRAEAREFDREGWWR